MGAAEAALATEGGASVCGVLKGFALLLRAERIAKRRRLVEEALAEVERKSGTSFSALVPKQQAVLSAVTQVLAVVSSVPGLVRLAGYFLCTVDFRCRCQRSPRGELALCRPRAPLARHRHYPSQHPRPAGSPC